MTGEDISEPETNPPEEEAPNEEVTIDARPPVDSIDLVFQGYFSLSSNKDMQSV